MTTYDVAIIGAGPVGLAAINTLTPSGKNIIVFEKNRVGGTCLNEGCMPTKALLHSANLLSSVKSANQFGVHASDITFNYSEVFARKNKLIEALQEGSSQKVKASGVTYIPHLAKLIGEDKEGVLIQANEVKYRASKVIIGAGSDNLIPPIPGIHESNYISSREALNLDTVPKSLTVIGGGVLGMEFASLFATFGAKVDLIEMSQEILPNMDQELAGILREYYESKNIRFHLNSVASNISKNTVTVKSGENTYDLTNDVVLLAAGRKPAIDTLGLETVNIEIERGAIKVNDYMQTSHQHIYACGDSIGGSMLAHTGLQEGAVAAMHILGMNHKLNQKAIPSVVYTNPELASVGFTEKELQAQNIPYKVSKSPLAASGRYLLDNTMDTPGVFKAYIHKESQEVLGVNILGNPASELIAIAGMAIQKKMTAMELKTMVFPHPTVSAIYSHAL